MSIYDTHKPAASEGSGLYLKIQDGETVRLRIVSEPAIMEAESEDKQTGETRLATRYGWVVWNQDSKQAQVLSQGVRFFRSIAALAQDEDWGDPTGYDIKVTRTGSDTSTTYTINPSPNKEPLGSDAKELIAKVDLIQALEASPFNQRVQWLSAFDNNVDQSALAPTEAAVPQKESTGNSLLSKATPSKPIEKDVVIEDIPDEPINLDDIPF